MRAVVQRVRRAAVAVGGVEVARIDRGLLVLEAGDDCVRMSPPLVVTEEEAATAIRIFTEAVEAVVVDREAAVAAFEAEVASGRAAAATGAG